MDRSGRRHLLDELAWRGMVAHATDLDALRARMDAGPITVYCGFDPTAPSLQFGNLVQLVTLRRFQDAGHRIIGLVGGATGMVGDPSGKSEERALNDAALVTAWVDRIRDQVTGVLRFDGDNPGQGHGSDGTPGGGNTDHPGNGNSDNPSRGGGNGKG